MTAWWASSSSSCPRLYLSFVLLVLPAGIQAASRNHAYATTLEAPYFRSFLREASVYAWHINPVREPVNNSVSSATSVEKVPTLTVAVLFVPGVTADSHTKKYVVQLADVFCGMQTC
jgi:hypothetical protein